MSLIGPRPERAIFYEEFEPYIQGFKQRLMVKPGMSGLAQVTGGYDFTPEEKAKYDFEYMRTRTIWLDMKLMVLTLGVVLTRRGAR